MPLFGWENRLPELGSLTYPYIAVRDTQVGWWMEFEADVASTSDVRRMKSRDEIRQRSKKRKTKRTHSMKVISAVLGSMTVAGNARETNPQECSGPGFEQVFISRGKRRGRGGAGVARRHSQGAAGNRTLMKRRIDRRSCKQGTGVWCRRLVRGSAAAA